MNFPEFLQWENSTKDTLDFKRVYVDIVGDLKAGLVLSHLVYWYLPDKKGKSRLRVNHDGEYWIAVRRYDWWERTRMSPKEIDRALKILRTLGVIKTRVYKFDAEPTVHIQLLIETFLARLAHAPDRPPENPYEPKKGGISPKVENLLSQKVATFSTEGESPYTKTPTKNTKQRKKESPASVEAGSDLFSLKDGVADLEEAFDEIDKAIAQAWKTSAPGLIDSLKKTLLGLHPPESPHYLSNVRPPATSDEILELGMLYQHRCPDWQMPQVPEKIQDWMYQLRDLGPAWVQHKEHIVPLKIKVPKDKKSPQAIWKYVRQFYPEEASRLEEIYRVIDKEAPPKREMSMNSVLHYRGESIHLNVPIPLDLHGDDTVKMYEYLTDNYPSEYERLKAELDRIDRERDRELAEIIG